MDEINPSATETVDDLSVLGRILEPEETLLLQEIWLSVSNSAELYGFGPIWPVWDFVSRQLITEKANYPDPDEVLAQLPRVRRPGTKDQTYGLVWRERPSGAPLLPDERVGLTIAGLRALAKSQDSVSEVADMLAAFVGDLAKRERALPSGPQTVAEARILLTDFGAYAAWFTQATPARRNGIPLDVVTQILNWEYARISIGMSGDGPQIQLRGLGLQPFLAVGDADAYLRRISISDAEESSALQLSSPLTLVQTIDYLAYVLQAHPAWKGARRFVQVPDLQSASALGMAVTNRHGFESSVTSLWNVIGKFEMPAIPDELIKNAQEQSSVNQLHYWLEQQISAPLPARLEQAIDQIRSVGILRQSWVHASDSTRAVARKRQRALGLPESITDWSGAWVGLCSSLAGAFDLIRQEVQLASR
jgi:hypothetical protein